MTDSQSEPNEMSMRFGRVLFATDFSPASEKALRYVGPFARRFGAEIYVTHVVSQHEFVEIEDRGVETFDSKRRRAESRVDVLLASADSADISHEVLVEQGGVWEVLSQLAERHNVDLIAAGTHGPHGFEKLVMGSTAETIERLSTRPVLLVGPDVIVDPLAMVNIGCILFATDFRPESRCAVEYACALARAYTAQLLILHVIDNPLDEALAARMSDEAFCRLRMAENKWPEQQLGVRPEFLVEFGSPEEQTLQVLAKRDVQLLVLSAPRMSHLQFNSRLPGPLSYHLVTRARCPVLTVREEKTSR